MKSDYLNQHQLLKDSYSEFYVLHIPHSSTFIPDYSGYLLDHSQIQDEINLLTDWATDKIFDFPNIETVKSEFSRVFCDVERFDDEHEPMFTKGAGIAYTRTDNGKEFRFVSSELKEKILRDFYHAHHQRLEDAVSAKLEKFGTVTILDCHSFSSIPLRRESNQNLDRPDICLGSDDFHTPKELVDQYTWFFEQQGLSVKVNEPYSGCITPLKMYQKDKRVKGIMIEVNKRLYMNEETFEIDFKAVSKLQNFIAELLF